MSTLRKRQTSWLSALARPVSRRRSSRSATRRRCACICVDGATRIGAKILVSGGSRCNVTNREVTEQDFWGGPSRIVRSVLRAFPAAQRRRVLRRARRARCTRRKTASCFPTRNKARDVLDALLGALRDAGAELHTGARVTAVTRDEARVSRRPRHGVAIWRAPWSWPPADARCRRPAATARATSLPRALGHGYVETTPALAPLVLDGDRHAALAGVSHRVRLTLRAGDGRPIDLEGRLLWTHFGASGPVVLERVAPLASGAARRAPVDVLLNLCPGRAIRVAGGLAARAGSGAPARTGRHGARGAAAGGGRRRMGRRDWVSTA